MSLKTKSGEVSFDLKRFAGIKRDYSKEDVEKLKGTFNIEYTLCKSQSEKLWNLLNTEAYINTLGSLSGNQSVQHAKAGLKAIYLSGWQVAADANSAGEMYPDQSLLYLNPQTNYRPTSPLNFDTDLYLFFLIYLIFQYLAHLLVLITNLHLLYAFRFISV